LFEVYECPITTCWPNGCEADGGWRRVELVLIDTETYLRTGPINIFDLDAATGRMRRTPRSSSRRAWTAVDPVRRGVRRPRVDDHDVGEPSSKPQRGLTRLRRIEPNCERHVEGISVFLSLSMTPTSSESFARPKSVMTRSRSRRRYGVPLPPFAI